MAEFSAQDFPILERASTHYALASFAEYVTVMGTVTLLDRPAPKAPGIFRLNVIEGSRAKKIRVRVSAEVYETVIQAFQQGMGLIMSGRQEKVGRFWWLYDPENIRAVPLAQLSLFDVADPFDTEDLDVSDE